MCSWTWIWAPSEPTLQAILWLSELVAATHLKNQKLRKLKGTASKEEVLPVMQDIVAQTQRITSVVEEQDQVPDTAVLTAFTARILSAIVTLVAKLGT